MLIYIDSKDITWYGMRLNILFNMFFWKSQLEVWKIWRNQELEVELITRPDIVCLDEPLEALKKSHWH